MNTEDKRQIILRALQSSCMIINIEYVENFITVYFKDGTSCNIELKYNCQLNSFGRRDEEELVEYYMNHDRKEFINAVRSIANENPGTYCMIIIILKLQDLGVITPEISMVITERLYDKEKELDKMFVQLLSKFK